MLEMDLPQQLPTASPHKGGALSAQSCDASDTTLNVER
jgi:hypothetical protein